MSPAEFDSTGPTPLPTARSWRAYLSSLRGYPRPAWNAAIACAVAMALSPAAFLSVITFMVGPVSKEFGWTISDTLTVYSVPLLIAPLALPLAGRWVDRFGARVVAIPNIALFGVTTAAIALVGASKLQLIVLLAVSNAFGFMGALGTCYKVVSAWFPGHRGAGFSLVIGATSSLAGAVLSPLSELGVSTVGWRGTYVLLGVAVVLIALPVQVFLLSEPTGATAADEPRVPVTGTPFLAALRTRRWVLTIVVLLCAAGVVASVRQNAVALLGERGYTAGLVSLSLSALLISSVVGQILAGVVLDRARSPRASMPFFATVPIGIGIIATTQNNAWLLFVAMCLLGVATGAESTVGAYLVNRYFGLRAFGQIQGFTLFLVSATIGLLPVGVQSVREHSADFTGALLGLLALGVLGAVVALVLPRYPVEAVESDVDDHEMAREFR